MTEQPKKPASRKAWFSLITRDVLDRAGGPNRGGSVESYGSGAGFSIPGSRRDSEPDNSTDLPVIGKIR
jgi:hypothetical protein